MSGKFATAIECIDGRTKKPIIDWVQQHLSVDFVDMITEPGPDKVLLQSSPEKLADIRRKVEISINAHNSRAVVVAAHHECAGNPVSRQEHIDAVTACTTLITSWNLDVRVIGLWVNDSWQVELITDSEQAKALATNR